MFKGLFGKRNETGILVVFDIAQGSVGGALILSKPEKEPVIRYAHRISYQPHSIRGTSTVEGDGLMLKALKLLAERICTQALPEVLKEKQGCRGVDEVVAFVGAPWVTSRILEHPVVSEERPITITDKWLRRVFDQVLAEKKEEGTSILERSVLRAHLNGYPTNDPRGKSAKRVNLSLFEATIPTGIGKNIIETLTGSFHTYAIVLRSSLLAQFTVVRDYFETENNFLLVTIGSQVSELAVVREDALMNTALLERGSHTLLEVAATRLRMTPVETTSVLAMHTEHAVHEENLQLQSDIAFLESDWQQALDKTFGLLKTERGLPRTVFLSAPQSTRAWFTKLLRNPVFSTHTLTHEPFRVVELNGEELLHHHHVHTDVVPDSALSLEMLFLHKIRSARY